MDDRGYTVNGLVEFNGEANLAAGNPDKEGLAFGDYDVTEDDTPDGLQPINPFSIRTTDKKDDKGNLTGYTITFKDKVTGQVISTNDISLEQMKDNNIMIKLNLGTFTDKPIEPLNPALTSTATDKSDGDKTLGVGEAQITDKVTASGLKANTTYQLESQPVSKSDGKPLKDKDGKSSLIKQEVKTDQDGNFSVDVTSSVLDTTGLQEKSITLLTKVKDSEGKVVVEDQNYKNNPTETVAVDKADGHTEVQDKEITPETKTVTDRYFYEGLVKGNTYTVKISQAFDHNLNKVIDVDGELTFKAEDTKGTVDVRSRLMPRNMQVIKSHSMKNCIKINQTEGTA
ncbi:VaFE repeat-containing surface-anchored protein [Lactococcus garvieae]